MDANSNIHGDYGEKFWDDVMSTSSECPDLSNTVEIQSNSDGVDILQQSLKEANILEGSNDPNSLSFDDFGLLFNNRSNNSNVLNNYGGLRDANNSPAASVTIYSSSDLQTDNTPGSFDVSEYLNISTAAATQTAVTTSIVNKPNLSAPPALTNVKFATHPQAVVHHQHAISQRVVTTQSSNVLSNPTAFTTVLAKPTPPKPTAYIQLQLTKNSSITGHSTTPKVVASSHNTQYVISSVQTVPTLSLSYTVQPISTVQSQSVAVCSSIFTQAITHPITTPSMYSINSLTNQAATKTLNAPMVQAHPVLHQKHALASHEQQTNKLALLLQNKAVNQPGVAGKFLKVGNQNINVSDPAVAKALASRILQQKLNQQKPNQVTVIKSSTPVQSISHNVTVINLPVAGIKNSVATSSPQLLYAQVPSVSVSGEIPHKSIVTRNNELPRQVLKSASPLVTNKASPVVQLLSRDNSSPVNRYQIASVNISRPSSQPSHSNVLSQRVNSPVQRFVTMASTSTALSINIVKPNPVQGSAQPSVVTTSTEASTLVQYLGTTMRLNLTPQQVKGLTTAQLQKIYLQHQAALNARKPAVAQSNPPAVHVVTCSAAAGVQPGKPLQSNENGQDKLVTFRVDPNLTSQQVDEVQQIILKRVPLKVHQLTNEQKQLLSAFRAQLRTMETTIQQYYLRNPHLFLQKVFQHVQSGKPFLFQVKVDQLNQNKNLPSTTSSVTSKPSPFGNSHPTITLTPDPGRAKASTVPAVRSTHSVAFTPAVRKVKRSANVVADVSLMHTLPSKRPSLIMEQLNKHRELTETPNVDEPFKSVRDAYRRLLPYHITNTPTIKEESFNEGEKIYDELAESASAQFRKMLKKHHTLCLKDAAMEVCSADVVLLDRAYLQHEKACLLEMKQLLKDDSDAILSYLPRSYATEHPDVVAFLEDRVNSKLYLPSSYSEDKGKVSTQSGESLNVSNLVSSDMHPKFSESIFVDSRQSETNNNDLLLQEAVESILT